MNFEITDPKLHIATFHVIEGLRVGLSQFNSNAPFPSRYAGNARVALILRVKDDQRIWIYDSQSLLTAHKSELAKYFESLTIFEYPKEHSPNTLSHEGEIELPGLVSWSIRSHSAPFAAFFTDRPVGIRSAELIKTWLASGCWLLQQDLFYGQSFRFPNSSMIAMESFAIHAVEDYLRSQLRELKREDIDIRFALETILGVSVKTEEGRRPSGKLVFCGDHSKDGIEYAASFEEGSALSNHKHVSKLLGMVDQNSFLVAIDKKVVGIGKESPPANAVTAKFDRGKAVLFIGEDELCSVSNGQFHAASSGQLELLKDVIGNLELNFNVVQIELVDRLIENVRRNGHGCTLVIPGEKHSDTPRGEYLSESLSLEDKFDLIAGMTSIDGAILFDSHLRIVASGCLLDAPLNNAPDKSRGARYNAAAAYTHLYPNVVVVVVSADGMLSILFKGQDYGFGAHYDAPNSIDIHPPTLQRWLNFEQSDEGTIQISM